MNRKPICPDMLTKFYSEGTPVKEIAEFFGYTPVTISNRAKALGIPSHPKARKNKRMTAYHRFAHLQVIKRYEDGESLSVLKVAAKTDNRTLRTYLVENGVYIRNRYEQIAASMKKHGTRFHSPEHRLQRAIDKLPDPLGRHIAQIYRDGCSPNLRRFAEKYWLPFEMIQKIAYEIRDCVKETTC